MDERALRDELFEASRAAVRLGLNSGTAGNLSIRNVDRMLITPTGIPDHELTPDMMVGCNLQGEFEGRWLPSSEWSMHAAIYLAFPEAQAVVHAHPDNCVALSCLRRPLPAFHYMVASFGGTDVPCAAYETFGSVSLGKAAVEALQHRTACLLANHGMICFAANLQAAVAKASKLETLARQFRLTMSMGEPVMLNDAEMTTVLEQYRTYGQQVRVQRSASHENADDA